MEEYFDTFEVHRPHSDLNDDACVQLLRPNCYFDRRLIDSIYNQNELLKHTAIGRILLHIPKDRQFREAQGLPKHYEPG